MSIVEAIALSMLARLIMLPRSSVSSRWRDLAGRERPRDDSCCIAIGADGVSAIVAGSCVRAAAPVIISDSVDDPSCSDSSRSAFFSWWSSASCQK